MTNTTTVLSKSTNKPEKKKVLLSKVRPGTLFGLVLLLAFIFVAVFAEWLAPHDPYTQSLLRRLRPPVWAGGTWEYPFGTDTFGRDYLSRLIYGTRLSLIIGVAAAACAMFIGVTLGVLAGYFGGYVDRAISFFVTVRLALPSLLLALAILQIGGSGLTIVIIVLAITHWDRFAVVLRTASGQVAQRDFVMRSRAMGASDWRILWRDILPNVSGPIVVIFTFEMAQCILAAAALAFLGLGLQAPIPSWGLMMAEGRGVLTLNPWLITLAGFALMLLVLAVNLVGDGLRDFFSVEGRV